MQRGLVAIGGGPGLSLSPVPFLEGSGKAMSSVGAHVPTHVPHLTFLG